MPCQGSQTHMSVDQLMMTTAVQVVEQNPGEVETPSDGGSDESGGHSVRPQVMGEVMRVEDTQ
jgi:hypothetical protein